MDWVGIGIGMRGSRRSRLPYPSPALAAPRGRQEGASRARGNTGKTPCSCPAWSGRTAPGRIAKWPPARGDNPPRVHPSRQPGTPITRCCSDGFLRATSQAGSEKGRPGRGRRPFQLREKASRRETVSPGLLVGKLRPEHGEDCPRSAAECRSRTLVFRTRSLSTRDS